MKIELFYNPFFGETSLIIDGVKYTNTHSRLYSYLSQTIDSWLGKSTGSYKSWGGFFVELTEEINEDDYEFVFHGKKEDFLLITRAFSEQSEILKEHKYDPRSIRITESGDYNEPEIKNKLMKFVKYYSNAFMDQSYMENMEYIYRDAQKTGSADFEAIRGLYDRIEAQLLYAKSKSKDKVFWDELIGDIKDILKKGV